MISLFIKFRCKWLESESKRQQVLMGVNTATIPSAIITREMTFCYFLFYGKLSHA